MTTFAHLLKTYRQASGKTFAQLAAEVGYHPSYLSLVERGLRLLDEEGVVRLAKILGIDPSVALLAALRERLPEELRNLVPSEVAPSGQSELHTAARQLQAEHFDFEVEQVAFHASVDWEGSVRTIRSYESCRPNAAGRPVWEIVFRDRIAGVAPEENSPFPKFAVRSAPADLEYELSSGTNGHWRTHRLFFPKGWRRSPHRSEDAFSFVCESFQPQAFVLDATSLAKRVVSEGLSHPLRGSLIFHLIHFARKLEITLDFPKGYEPEKWEAWSWWGGGTESVTRNLAGKNVSRALELRQDGGHAELIVDEPIAGYSFALTWTPADRQRYLEARYGGAHDSQDLDAEPAGSGGGARS